MQEITVQDLYQLLSKSTDLQLLDVREQHERDLTNIGGVHIPMGEIAHQLDQLDKTKPVYVYCRSGMRSGKIADFLTNQGFQAINVKGGLLAYSDLDATIIKY